MPDEIRPIIPDEWDEYVHLDGYAFGYEANEVVIAHYREMYRPEWTLAAFRDGRMAAHLIAMPWQVRMGGAPLTMGAIADVAVWPERRRGGHAAALLRACLERMHDGGTALSMLYPTFYPLYRRFGWAQAAESRVYTFRPSELHFLVADPPAGHAERASADALPDLMAVYDAATARGMGAIVRDETLWRNRRLHTRPGSGALNIILWRGEQGRAEGYLLHTSPRRLTDGQADYDQELPIHELVTTTPDAYRGLLGYVSRHDLIDRATWSAPPDDPLPAMLADPARVRIASRPTFMLRLVRLVDALEGRGYDERVSARLVLDVDDPIVKNNSGRWLLTVESGKARVAATDAEPHLTCGIDVLAAMYAGFLHPVRTAHAGLIAARDQEAVATLARIFAVERPPYCLDYF
jgi:predicted acetyltransferase